MFGAAGTAESWPALICPADTSRALMALAAAAAAALAACGSMLPHGNRRGWEPGGMHTVREVTQQKHHEKVKEVEALADLIIAAAAITASLDRGLAD